MTSNRLTDERWKEIRDKAAPDRDPVWDEQSSKAWWLVGACEEILARGKERDEYKRGMDANADMLIKASRERDEARADLLASAEESGFWGRATARTIKQRDAARDALLEYGDHLAKCRSTRIVEGREICPCGWIAVRREVLGDE